MDMAVLFWWLVKHDYDGVAANLHGEFESKLNCELIPGLVFPAAASRVHGFVSAEAEEAQEERISKQKARVLITRLIIRT